MPSLRERVRTWLGPSRRELQAEIASLQERQRRFPRSAIASGVDMGWGEYEYEQNTKLQGAKKFAEFESMETDPHVKGVLLDKALPLLTAEWEIKPASDDPRDEDIAEFCAANLLRQSSDKYGREYWIQSSWKAQRLPEILSMLRDGFSMFVSSWRRVGMRQVYDRLQWIEPSTIDGTVPWELDEQDNIIAINRKLTTPGQNFLYDERIEAERLKLYVWDLRGARFEGRSLIRSMFGAWLRKEFMQRQAAIWAQKAGAPPPIGFYTSNFSQTDIARFKQVVMASRGSSPAETFGMFPMAADGTHAEITYPGTATGEVDRMRSLINGENQEIHHAGRDSASMLGETQSGSRALGDSKGKRELKFTQAVGEMVSEWENHGPANLQGVVEELVDRNFGNVRAYPELVCTKVDPLENFEETVEAWKAGIIPKVPDARRQLTEGVLGLNLDEEDYEVEDVPPSLPTLPGAAPNPPGGVPSAGATPPNTDQSATAALDLESVEEFKARIAPLLEPVEDAPKGAGFRGRNRLEVETVNLAAINETFRVGERDFLLVLRKMRRAMTDELMARLRAGKVKPRNVGSMRRSKFKGEAAAVAQLLQVAQEVGEKAFAHVQAEIQQQTSREVA